MNKLWMGAAASTLALGVGAFAQNVEPSPSAAVQPAQEGTSLAEVVVTALRRSENLQTTPLALTAVSGDALAATGVIQPQNLNAAVAGLALSPNGSITQVYLRGVGTFSGPIGDSSVLVSLDGVVLNSPSMISGNFFDLDRIEVLKGPQGTLYGRNATAGAINIITKQPILNNYGGDASVEIGNYDLYRFSGAVNLPVGDTFAVRAATQIVRRNGYFTDGSADDNGESFRLQGRWEASPTLTNLLSVDYSKPYGRGVPYVPVPFVNPSNPYVGPSTTLGNSRLQAAITNGVPGVFPPNTPFPLVQNNSKADTKQYGVRDQLEWNLDFATLTAVGAYRRDAISQLIYPGFSLANDASEHETSGELRLASADHVRLQWLIGGFFFDDTAQTLNQPSQGISAQQVSLNQHTRSHAAFGEATYGLTDSVRVTGGVRYTQEDRSQTGADAFLVPPPTRIFSFPGQASFSNVSYKGALEYDVAPRSMIYGSVSTGFRSGGINPDIAPNTYSPEKMLAYTLGSKNRFFNDHLQLNAEAFYWDYTNHQENILLPLNAGGFGILIQNIGKSSLKGVNVDLQFQPQQNDLFTGQVEYVQATFDKFSYDSPLPEVAVAPRTGCSVSTRSSPGNPGGLPFIPPSHVDCDGKPFTHAPKWSAVLGYQHDFPLGHRGKIVAGASSQVSSSYYTATDYIPNELQGAYALFNAHIGYESPGGNWSLTGYVRNIGDKAVVSSSFEHPFLPGLVYGTLNPPRTFGATLQAKF